MVALGPPSNSWKSLSFCHKNIPKKMAESEKGNDLQETLKPFYQRASQAEDRLSRLEAALASKKDTGNEEHSKTISELQSKLEDAHSQLVSEREEARKLAAENAKLQYRIHHLVQAVKESDQKDGSIKS